MHDPNLHLFVDDREIHHYVNLRRILNRPQRFAEPVVKSDTPWERGCRNWAWGSVIQEPDGLLRMYYMIFNTWKDPGTLENGNFGYAESRDGIHWEKPPLGLYEFQGSKENNIVLSMGSTGTGSWYELARRGGGLTAKDREGNSLGVLNNADGITVFRDDTDPDPQKRYKLIANMQDHRMWAKHQPEDYADVTPEQVAAANKLLGQYMLTSPDGLHWSQEPIRLKGDCHGDYMMVIRDHRNQQWWMNERPMGLFGRNAGLSASKNLFDWTTPTEAVFVNGEDSGFGQMWEWHNGITPFNYGNQDLGLLEHWTNFGWGDTCELVSHRDGEPWQRVAPNRMFLDIGPEGAFDRLMAYPLHNPPAQVGDKLHIYYNARGFEPETGRYNYGSIGVMTIGLDRFVGMAHFRTPANLPGGSAGTILTRPLEVAGDTLQINVEASGGQIEYKNGHVCVGIKNAEGADIPGFTVDDCEPVGGDQVRGVARWKENADLSRLRGQRVMLVFSVRSAVLYSYRWAGGENEK